MQKQKKGFWVFICSLVPGAGEMYMGFFKQGISIMLLFWSIVAVAACFEMGFLTLFLPVIWLYSFFNVHNLKSLSPEEFYAVEDHYILHADRFFGDIPGTASKYRKLAAVLLIFFGVAILWNSVTGFLYWLLPGYLYNIVHEIFYRIPQIIIAIIIIMAGYYILTGKKKRLGGRQGKKNMDEEHYWEPYRPYQQAAAPETDRQYHGQNQQFHGQNQQYPKQDRQFRGQSQPPYQEQGYTQPQNRQEPPYPEQEFSQPGRQESSYQEQKFGQPGRQEPSYQEQEFGQPGRQEPSYQEQEFSQEPETVPAQNEQAKESPADSPNQDFDAGQSGQPQGSSQEKSGGAPQNP